MDRFEIIRNKAKRDKEIKEKALNDTKTKEEALLEQSKALYPRIKYLIDLANECINNNIEIPSIFLSDDCGYLGFLKDEKVIAIIDGLRIDSDWWFDFVAITEDNTMVHGDVGIYLLSDILNNFDSFEKKFLDYIDSLA